MHLFHHINVVQSLVTGLGVSYVLEIADGILYFVDDAAAAVNGEIMDINGGAYMC